MTPRAPSQIAAAQAAAGSGAGPPEGRDRETVGKREVITKPCSFLAPCLRRFVYQGCRPPCDDVVAQLTVATISSAPQLSHQGVPVLQLQCRGRNATVDDGARCVYAMRVEEFFEDCNSGLGMTPSATRSWGCP